MAASHFLLLNSDLVFKAANKINVKPKGRIIPFIAPTVINTFIGRPIKIKMRTKEFFMLKNIGIYLLMNKKISKAGRNLTVAS